MQKTFDLLLKNQMEKLMDQDSLSLEMSGNNLNFEIVEEKTFDNALSFTPNPEKSKIIENLFVEETPVEDQTNELEK